MGKSDVAARFPHGGVEGRPQESFTMKFEMLPKPIGILVILAEVRKSGLVLE
jgi:hypothetical protein